VAKRKKRSVLRSLFTIFLLFCGISVAIYYAIDFLTTPSRINYPAFGIYIPPDYSIHGIDVSHYQQVIDWNDVKAMQVKNIKIGFVFIKATEGIGKIDAYFRRNWLQAEEENIPKGAYHYFIAGEGGSKQAQNFIDIVKLKKGDLPPVLDIEHANGKEVNNIRTEIRIWLAKIEQHYKIKPVIYTNIDFYNNYLNEILFNFLFIIYNYLHTLN